MNKYTLSILLLGLFLISNNTNGQDLISSQYLGELSKIEMQAFYGSFMQNGIKRYKITYTTKDIHGVQDTASGLVVVPIRAEPSIYPLLCYQHGTVGGPNDVPSNLNGGSALATVWGGLGYITSAADYLGLGTARGFHPYVHADSEASAAVDMLFAVRQFVAENGYFLNDQLFITGYSQGGHAAAAVQRSIQENYPEDFTITASAPMSGPYSISTAMVGLSQVEEPYYFIGYLPYTVLSMNLAYNLGYDLEEIFKEPYVAAINSFFNREINIGALHSSLIASIAIEEQTGPIPRLIFQDSFLLNMDNNYNHPFNVALRDNDVYDWAPSAPTRLYYCMADDQVPFLNSIIADSIMNLNGAADVQAIDVNSGYDHGQCVNPAVTQAAIFFLPFQSITTGTDDYARTEKNLFYPNPGTGIFHYKPIINTPVDIKVFNLTGQLQYQKTDQQGTGTLDISHLTKGIYLIQLKTKNFSSTEKIILQ